MNFFTINSTKCGKNQLSAYGKTILNNVYMDLRGRKPVFKRTRTVIERNSIFATIKRYTKKLKTQYNGDVYLETVRCYFDMSQENLGEPLGVRYSKAGIKVL